MATPASTALAPDPAQGSPWDEAIQLLRPDAAEEIRLKKDDKLHVLAEVLAAANEKKDQMRDKQWKYTRSNGTTVVFRDIFDKIALRLNKLKDIGDTLTQVDPLNAGVPWAVIKFFLQAAVADTEKLGIIFDGIEMIVGMISKYAIFEKLYLQGQMQATHLFRKALVRLYASILSFLAEAKYYYAERTGIRLMKSTFQIGLSKMAQLKQEIQDEQVAVVEIARLIDAENLRALNGDIKSLPSELTNTRKALDQLELPLKNANDQLEGIVNRLERMQIFELLGWISNMPYIQHHETVRSGRLENSGLWLFDQSDYMDWRKSQSSSLLWLHGMPGSGKSKLVSFLVDTLKENQLNAQTEALAYVYCTQSTSEPERAEPDSILRSIARQLTSASKDMSIREPTLRKYRELQEHGLDLGQLRLEEVKFLILELLVNTPTTIVIDALDECNPKRRFELISMLAQLLQEKNCLVKILVSSRDPRLPTRLKMPSTFIVDASRNTQDIDRFVDLEVRKAIHEERLLEGNVSTHLEAKIISTLKNGAQGMFLWVSLQIQNLCDPEKFKLEEDVLEELGRLPQELRDIYAQMCNKVMGERTKRVARKVAETALRWLLCAQKALSTDDFITAVYFSATGGKTESPISSSAFLDICGNMLIPDKELDVFRFLHPSVREFLQTRPDFAPTLNHVAAAEICISTLLAQEWLSSEREWQSASLCQYVTLFWAVHLENSDRDRIQSENIRTILTQLSVVDRAPPWFVSWLLRIESASVALEWNNPLKKKVENALCDAPVTAFFMACAFGLMNIVDILSQSDTKMLRRQNARKATGLHIACQFGCKEIVELLLARGSSVNRKDTNGGSPLFLASLEGFDEIVKILLEHGADPTIEHSEYGTALQAASLRGHESVVRSLVKKVNIDSEGGQFGTALQAASLRGHAAVVRILLDEGADVNALGGQYKITPELASTDTRDIAGMARAFKLLLERTSDQNEGTNLFRSMNSQFEAFVQLLLDQHVDINIEKEGFGTALQAASRGGHADIVKILLDAGADVNVEGGAYGTAIQAAAVSGRPEVITILLENGADVNSETGIYNTALQAACRHNHSECFNMLLDNEAYVNAQGGLYGTALQAAVRAGSLPFVERILSQGGYVDACGGQYGTALQAACSNGSLEIVQVLLDHNADLDIEGGQFGTALQSACANGHLDVVRLLVGKGAKLGRALQVASLGGHEDIVCFLMEEGLDPNSHEGAFGTALEMAAAAGRENVVHLLTEHQASLDHNYDQFGTALQVAAAIGNHNLVRLLLNKGADPTISGRGVGMKVARVFSHAMNDTFDECKSVSALEAAAESGHEGIVQTILEWYSMNGRAEDLRVDYENPAFQALQKASKQGNTKIVQLLLENGVPISSGDADSPLICACQNGHEGIVRILLDQPGQPYYPTKGSLLAAIEGNHKSIADLLLARDKAIELGEPHLYSASYQGNLPVVRKFLESGIYNGVVKEVQCNAVFVACFRGHTEIVNLLLENNVDVNLPFTIRSGYGKPACFRGYTEIAELLLENNTDVDFFGFSIRSGYDKSASSPYPLQAAAFQGHEDIVEMLISRGASVNNRGGFYETALIAASFRGHLRIVEILVENDADLNIVTRSRSKMGTALQAAAHNGHAKIVEFLLANSADVNAQGGKYGTAIQAAAFFGHEEVVRLLIQWGANLRDQGGKPEAVSTNDVPIEEFKYEEYRAIEFLSSIVPKVHSSGRSQNGKFGTALQAAAVNGNARIIRLLLEHGADAGDSDMHGQTPLHRAAYHGHEEAVSVLLEYGTAIETKDVLGRTALSWAAFWGYDKLLKFLSHSGASIDEQDSSGRCALHQAARNGQLEIMKSLLDKGANLECTDKLGCTPLFSALESGRLSSICFLLGQGACVTHRNSRGLTILHEVALAGYSSMIRPILASGLSIDAQSSVPEDFSAQSTPLHLAAFRGNYELSYFLMLNGASVNARDSSQRTPLHLAVEGGFRTVVTLLLKWRATVNTDSQLGRPLHLAAKGGHGDIVRLLLERGGNIDARDTRQRTALHFAAEKGYRSVVAVLLEQGAACDAQDRDQQTPLHLAASCHKGNVARLLLDKGADVNARNKDGETPLYLCARKDGWSEGDDVTKLLLERGSNLEAKNHQGETPLTVAGRDARLKIEQFLLLREREAWIKAASERILASIDWSRFSS